MSGMNQGIANGAKVFAAKSKKTVTFENVVSDFEESDDDGGAPLCDGGGVSLNEGAPINGTTEINGRNGVNGTKGVNDVNGHGINPIKLGNRATYGILKSTSQFDQLGGYNSVQHGVQYDVQNGVQNGMTSGDGFPKVNKKGLDPTCTSFTPSVDDQQHDANAIDEDATPRASLATLTSNGAATRPAANTLSTPTLNGATAARANGYALPVSNDARVHNGGGGVAPLNDDVAHGINGHLTTAIGNRMSLAPHSTIRQSFNPLTSTNLAAKDGSNINPGTFVHDFPGGITNDAATRLAQTASYPSLGYLTQSDSESSLGGYPPAPMGMMNADHHNDNIGPSQHAIRQTGFDHTGAATTPGFGFGPADMDPVAGLETMGGSYNMGSLTPFQRRMNGHANGQTNGQGGAYNGMQQNGNMATAQTQPESFLAGHNAMAPYSPVTSNSLVYQAKPVYAPVPVHIQAKRSEQLNQLTSGPTGRPTIDQVLDPDNFPFLESVKQTTPTNQHGVVKLKNIPFATRRAEIIAFFGRNSKILNDTDEGVHIIMERVTSKTNDAYVEFMTLHDAMTAVEKNNIQQAKGRLSRLGDRPIEVELSCQAALMKDLFPLATGIFWDNAVPRLTPHNEREPWNNFKCFFSEEEMTMLVKHVEVPQRSPFSRDCPQRPFECMISTIKKMPWYMSHLITVRQRYAVYQACLALVGHLQHAVRIRKSEEVLSPQLLKRLVTTAMLCPGFTVLMKDNIAFQAGMNEAQVREFNQPRFANLWVHQYSLSPKPGVPLDVLEWYIAVIREESTRQVNAINLNERAKLHAMGAESSTYWGFYWYFAKFPTAGKEFDSTTLAALNILECEAIQNIFIRAFTEPTLAIQA